MTEQTTGSSVPLCGIKSIEINRWQTQTQGGNRAVKPLNAQMTAFAKPGRKKRKEKKPSPSWKKDSSKDSDSYTFDKNLREALLLPNHALVGCVIRQVALVDSECPLVAHALKHIPVDAQGMMEEDYTRTYEERGTETERERERIMNKCIQQIQPQSDAEGPEDNRVTHSYRPRQRICISLYRPSELCTHTHTHTHTHTLIFGSLVVKIKRTTVMPQCHHTRWKVLMGNIPMVTGYKCSHKLKVAP